jgi:hypothetical protein
MFHTVIETEDPAESRLLALVYELLITPFDSQPNDEILTISQGDIEWLLDEISMRSLSLSDNLGAIKVAPVLAFMGAGLARESTVLRGADPSLLVEIISRDVAKWIKAATEGEDGLIAELQS